MSDQTGTTQPYWLGNEGGIARPSPQWQEMEDLFLKVLEQPTEHRAAFLAETCQDSNLCRFIESMLRADVEATAFLEEPRVPLPFVGEMDRGPEDRIDNYRLDREIGEGGMGRVYLAYSMEDDLDRPVAIKVTRRGLKNHELAQRLRIERRILAGLNHPAIARLYDGGTTRENRPYFVMEYVEGEPIDKFCDRRGLSVSERVELFCEVCAAVRYAHQNLVVHRDLKPSNILVTAEGKPKLLDFGIAKMLDPEASLPEVALTASGLRPMTPGYASPEQFSGQRITTASDVYSLGVLLYKLLSGFSPFDFSGLALKEVEHIVLEEEPAKPSLRVIQSARHEPTMSSDAADFTSQRAREGHETLRRQLRGDLDSIVLKALRKAPAHRYGSVEELSEDLRRHLEGLPVTAHQGSWRYRALKFARRHRVSLTVAALIAAIVLGFTAITLNQAVNLAHERDQSRQVIALMKSIFIAADPYEKGKNGSDLTVRQALEISEESIRRQLKDQPKIRATVLNILGRIHMSLGSSQAQVLLEDALTLRREVYGERHPAVAQTLGNLAHALGATSDATAIQKARDAVAMLRESGPADSPLLLEALNNLVTLLCYEGANKEADPLSLEALEMAESLPPTPWVELFYALNNRGIVLLRQGERVAARALFERALHEQEETLGPEHPWVGETLNTLANDLKQRKEYDQALALHQRSASIRRKHLGADNPVLANSHSNHGDILRGLGDLEGAREAYLKAAEILAKTIPENLHRLLIETKIAQIHMDVGELEAAEQRFRASLGEWSQRRPTGHWVISAAESAFGECLVKLHKYSEAEALLTRSLEAFREEQSARGIQETLARFVKLYEAWDKPAQAASYRSMLKLSAS